MIVSCCAAALPARSSGLAAVLSGTCAAELSAQLFQCPAVFGEDRGEGYAELVGDLTVFDACGSVEQDDGGFLCGQGLQGPAEYQPGLHVFCAQKGARGVV